MMPFLIEHCQDLSFDSLLFATDQTLFDLFEVVVIISCILFFPLFTRSIVVVRFCLKSTEFCFTKSSSCCATCFKLFSYVFTLFLFFFNLFFHVSFASFVFISVCIHNGLMLSLYRVMIKDYLLTYLSISRIVILCGIFTAAADESESASWSTCGPGMRHTAVHSTRPGELVSQRGFH